MKKILFLLLICFIKLNAYNYLIEDNQNLNNPYKQYFTNEYGNVLQLVQTKEYLNNGDVVLIGAKSYGEFSNIKRSLNTQTIHYISKENFDKTFKNDLLFLNDLFTTTRNDMYNCFLNYLYNSSSSFNNTNYINYEDYQILYNEDGLAVESIVGGVWKGLYDTPEKSGFLYDRNNNILYHNGEVASLFNRFWFSLTGNVSKTLKVYYISILGLNVFILILAVYLVKVLLGLIIKWITTVINNTKVNVNLGAQKGGEIWR